MTGDLPTKAVDQQRAKRTLFQVIRDRLKEKPATPEEIAQLKLDAERAKIKLEIIKAKTETKRLKPNRLAQFLGGPSTQPSVSKKTKKKGKTQTVDFEDRIIDRKNNPFGTNDASRYKDLIGDR